jgi:glucosamine-phosphate N-acetyltransferase
MESIKYDYLINLIEKYDISKINKSFINLLKQLTIADDLLDDIFLEKINSIFKMGTIYVSYVEDDKSDIIIIGTGTIIIEPKLIHNGMSIAHIEDIVVDNNYRKNGITQIILDKLTEYAINNNCYKIILDCNENIKKVYEKNGFIKKDIQMVKYF